MKKIKFSVIFVITMSIFLVLSSCQNAPAKVTTTVTTEKVTYDEAGFYVEQQIIAKGNTVWGISKKVYGNGMKWREIVAMNPFLNNPNRMYYNPEKKIWIVRIYPGEFLTIGGQMVYPSCVYESTKTETISEPADSSFFSSIPWWGWLMIAGVIALIIWLFDYNRPNNHSHSTTGIRNVDMNRGEDINSATNRTILEQRQLFWNKALATADKANISSLDIHLGVNDFDIKASYFEAKCQNQKKEIKKTETEDKKDAEK